LSRATRALLLAAGVCAFATPVASGPVEPLAANPADTKTLAADFVKSYADVTGFGTIGRWARGLCVNVMGASSEQAEAVRARVAAVANSLGLIAWNSGCQRYNVQIGLTDDPQAMLDSAVKASKINVLGDFTSDTRKVKTVTLPIQAWYVTDGKLYAQNDRRDANPTDGPMVPVVYQQPGGGPPAGAPQGYPNGAAFNPSPGSGPGNGYPTGGGGGGGVGGGGGSSGRVRAFINVMVIVDLRKTGGLSPGALADYAAMLALSKPRAPGQCNVLPSITDLFASCPGRPAPDGLTPADTAYLTALYTAKGAMVGSSHETHVIDRMADLLAHPQAIDPNLAKARETAAAASAQ
jgi:hypothetical protein